MTVHQWAMVAAGGIGCTVAIVHGVLMQRLIIIPILEGAPHAESIRRLFPLLVQFSTVCWLFGGIALMAAPFWFDASATFTTSIFVGSFYAFGSIGNFWGTKGRHPGWVLLAIAVGLIGFALMDS